MKQLLNGVILTLGILILVGCNIQTYEIEKIYTIDADELDMFVVEHQEGDVILTGIEDSHEIIVRATFETKSEEIDKAQLFSEENIDVSLERENSSAILKTSINQGAVTEQGNAHLQIEVPAHLPIKYRQNEGELKAHSMKNDMEIQHGSDHLILEDIEGDIKIVDGADRLSINRVIGDITLNKGSGNIEITETDGDLLVIAGSGNVNIQDVLGNINIRSGSGDVSIQEVSGDVTVLANRSGNLVLEEISGTVLTP